jgi:hypothetical protein
MLVDILLLIVGLTMIIFGMQTFLTPNRRKFANEMIRATTMVVMGMFVVYFWASLLSATSSGGYNSR